MKTYNVFNIQWDTEGEEVELPNHIIVNVPESNQLSCDIIDFIGDYITNEFGFCHFGFEFDEVKYLVFFGVVHFHTIKQDGVDKAVIKQIDAIKYISLSEANEMIKMNLYHTYVIPSLYNGEVVYEDEQWTCTDDDSNQWRKDISDNVFYFFECRNPKPETGESVGYEATIDLDDYSWHEKVDACEAYGHSAEEVDKWITQGDEQALIAECIFEMDVDNY